MASDRGRGQPTPKEPEDGDSSSDDMNMFWSVGPTDSSGQGSTEESSAEEMKLSRENYPSELPSMAAQTEPSVRPKTRQPMSSITSSIAQSGPKISRRDSLMEQPKAEEPSNEAGPPMQFKWDHYGSEFPPAAEMTGLEWIFGQKEDTKEEKISENILEDLKKLEDIGYIIDYPDGLLGVGFFGAVYKGYYGTDTQNLTNKARFAVKIVEFGAKCDRDTLERRERYETEKYIMTNVYHKNVVPIRMIINMGNHRSFPFTDNPQQRYVSPERVYLIMDYADEGDLGSYLSRHHRSLESYIVINWIRDLFAGMLYLHSNDIAHGDIQTGNVLLFRENDEVVAKWADFGLGFVGKDKQYQFRAGLSEDIGNTKKIKWDLEWGLCYVFRNILEQSKHSKAVERKAIMSFRATKGREEGMGSIFGNEPNETQSEEVKALRQLEDMTKSVKTADNLLEVYEQYKHVLEDELVLEEEYF